MATYANIMAAVRELSFDRFVTPTFFIVNTAKSATWTLEITATNFIIKDGGVTQFDIVLATVPLLKDLLDAIIASAKPVEVIFSGSYIPSEPTSSLLKTAPVTLDVYRPLFRSYYFSEAYIQNFFWEYLRVVMRTKDADAEAIDTPAEWDTEFGDDDFTSYRMFHFTYWVAYHLVGQRRLYELAGQSLQQSTLGGNPLLNGGTSFVSSSSFSLTGPGENTTVQVGDVFTLSEDTNTSLGIHNNGEIPQGMLPPWAVGSDNTLMDYYSFWYRLQLWLRDRLEQRTGDYSLRSNTVMTGKMYQDPRDSVKYYSYFDSYPWVFSPYLRGVPSTEVQNLKL